jgi:hypothetical protein
MSGWVGSIPMHSRHPIPGSTFASLRRTVTLRRSNHIAWSLAPCAMAALVAAPLRGQSDTTPVRAVAVAAADTVRSPITPKRAFLYSLVAPGASQNVLGRHRTAVGILAVELMSIVMIRESGADVRQARLQQGDSLVLSYVDDAGKRLSTPTLQRRPFDASDVSARRSHVEDWVALLVANHLFAAADAFVAASLWEVASRVTLSGNRNRLVLMGRFEW